MIGETTTSQPRISAALSILQYSREEAAEVLGVSIRTLDRLIALKELPVRRVGRRVLITYDALVNSAKRDHRTGGGL